MNSAILFGLAAGFPIGLGMRQSRQIRKTVEGGAAPPSSARSWLRPTIIGGAIWIVALFALAALVGAYISRTSGSHEMESARSYALGLVTGRLFLLGPAAIGWWYWSRYYRLWNFQQSLGERIATFVCYGYLGFALLSAAAGYVLILVMVPRHQAFASGAAQAITESRSEVIPGPVAKKTVPAPGVSPPSVQPLLPPQTASPAASNVIVANAGEESVDAEPGPMLQDACANEIELLCARAQRIHKGLRACLSGHWDGLTQPCKQALRGKRK